MAEVLTLVENDAPTGVDEDVVKFAQRLLQSARDGDFQGVAIVTVQVSPEGVVTAVGNGYEGVGIKEHRHTAIGGVLALQDRMVRELLER